MSESTAFSSHKKEDRDLVIHSNPGCFQLHLRDIWRYRDLMRMFVSRDFVAIYKQTI